jgi:hypothetical protein
MTPEEIDDQKRVEYYAASINAWFNTSLEHDKSLFTLSAGGIGLLITLLTTVGPSSAEALVLYIGAILSFVISLIAVLAVFKRNRTHIEEILSGKGVTTDPLLTKLDSTALFAFGIGVLFTAIIGISAAVNSYSTKEKSMSNENTNKTQQVQIKESFSGATNLQPATEVTKSFNGASGLQPPQTANTNSSSTQTTSTTTSQATTTQGGDKK